MSDRLGTAQWEEQALVAQRYPFQEGKFWLGRAEDGTPIGYRDDRHICLVSGNRGGKGTSVIINNLCFWPGSAVVVDPKGENATVTAARRGHGDEYCEGMGQAVHVLDPFRAAQVEECYRSSFNPLDVLDPNSDESIDESSRIANSIVVVKDDAREPFWDESARTMVRGLILYVLTAPHFADEDRNLITVRNLILRGEWQIFEGLRADGYAEEKIDPPHLLLWRNMERMQAFDGLVSGIGRRFRDMMKSADRTFEGVLQAVSLHTEFLDSPGMRKVLAKSDFKLSELKTRPEGMTLYLSLPQRYMDTHYRWLRMMVTLTTTQMEITRGQPTTGHPVLMVLDEFAGLKRMTAIESAVAQIAGFGVKLFFVLQSLEQLKGTYKDHWETFLANAGVKIFFSVEDHFTRDYVSKLAGETEIIRELSSSNESQAENESHAEGLSQSTTVSQSNTRGASESQTRGTSLSSNQSQTRGVNQSRNKSESVGTSDSVSRSRGSSGGYIPHLFGADTPYLGGWSTSESGSSGTSHSTTQGASEGTSSSSSRGSTSGNNRSETHGTSSSETFGRSEARGTSQTYTQGSTRTSGSGRSESVHRRPLIQPDEVGRVFARIDDRSQLTYPGLSLVMVTGSDPFVVRRTHYFEDLQFIDCFSPHPDHKFQQSVSHTLKSIRPLIDLLEASMNGRRLTITQWFAEKGNVIDTSQAIAEIEGVPPDKRIVYIGPPCVGKVFATAATLQNRLSTGDYLIPDGPLLTVKTYSNDKADIDPLEQLRAACRALLEAQKSAPRVAPTPPRPQPAAPRKPVPWYVKPSFGQEVGVFAVCALLGVVFAVLVVEGLELFQGSGHLINPFQYLEIFALESCGITLALIGFALKVLIDALNAFNRNALAVFPRGELPQPSIKRKKKFPVLRAFLIGDAFGVIIFLLIIFFQGQSQNQQKPSPQPASAAQLPAWKPPKRLRQWTPPKNAKHKEE